MYNNLITLLNDYYYIWPVVGVMTAASLCLITKYLSTRQLTRYLHKAKEEAREMAQISYLNPHPLIQISREGRIIFTNPAAGSAFPDLAKKAMGHAALSGLMDCFEETDVWAREIEIGDKIYHQTIAPVMRGVHQDLVIYCYDISQRKAYEESLRASEKRAEAAQIEAERANKARGDFLANMSHELRTPMNGIIGLTDMLLDGHLKEEQKISLQAVNKSSRNLLGLLDDLLDFSKIEAGELSIESIAYRPADVLMQIENLHKQVAVNKNLRLIADCDADVPEFLMGDPSRLLQILNNLVSNALKFTHEGDIIIEIKGEQKNDSDFLCEIRVRDTGIGIPKDKLERIFAKFQQADGSTARKYGGTGLGLAITKDLVKLMRGKITVDSEEGKGTCFTLNIPAKIADEKDVLGSHEALGDQNFALDLNARIMIVDDHPVNLLYMRQVLARAGFEDFNEASSGSEAVDLYQNQSYDLILMDCQMPDMDGYEASRKIRDLQNQYLKIPIIIAVTADAMKNARQKCVDAHMDDYISKPIDKMKLLQILHKWIPGAYMTDFSRAQDTLQSLGSGSDVMPFDSDRLYEFTGGKKDIEDQLISMFIEALKEDTAKMEMALRDENYQRWDEAVHKIYGAASNIGAYALAGLCDEAQNFSEADKTNIVDRHKEILSCCAEITEILQQRAAA